MTLDRLLATALFVLAACPAMGQQTHVARYDVFVGTAYLNSPAISLPEHGVQLQVGFRPRTWYSVGFDYSNVRGDLTLTPELLPDALQQRLGAQLAALAAAGQLPANYHLAVSARSSTQSFSLGPQLAYRHFKKVTLFLRPSMGAIREVAVPEPGDPIAKAIAAQLVPSGRKRDWTGFYGAGGGIDLNFNHHFSFRIQGDMVWDHLFNDVLKNGRRTYRLGVGPAFNFGRNIAAK
jgi:hypothetical protein